MIQMWKTEEKDKQARKDYSCGQSACAEINTKRQPTNNMYVQCYSVLVTLDVF